MGNRNCPVCGNNSSKFLNKINMKIPEEYHLPDSYDVVVCKECGMVYADTSASMADYDWYYANCNFYGDDSKDDNSARFESVERKKKKYVDKESVLLELGAGNGRFELALKEHGYLDVTGTDPSEESVKRLKEAGIKARVASVYSDISSEEYESYDGVFLFEVAEHLLVPGCGITNIERMLKKNGIFMVSVPDYSLIGEDLTSIPNYFNLEHINYFSETTLDYLMSLHGLERIDQKHFGVDLIQVYRKTDGVKTPGRDTATEAAVSRYFGHQQERAERIDKTVEGLKKAGTELVIWGTGSYVMNLFATTSLPQCNIKGFVDNNKLKQGRKMYDYTIYPPEYLKDTSYTVLICSMLYGEKIREQLEGMHTKNTIVVI